MQKIYTQEEFNTMTKHIVGHEFSELCASHNLKVKFINKLLADAIDASICISEETTTEFDSVLLKRLNLIKKILKEIVIERTKK